MPSETNDGNPFLVPTILVPLLNGLFSPALFWVVIVAPVWFPSLLLPMTQGQPGHHLGSARRTLCGCLLFGSYPKAPVASRVQCRPLLVS